MAEYYRQFAFVSSVLAGFAFTFYGTLLLAPTPHRTSSWAAFLSVAASIAFLLVTLGTTFAASRAARLTTGESLPEEITGQVPLLSVLFLGGIFLLLTSFGLGGWVRSRQLGIATTAHRHLGSRWCPRGHGSFPQSGQTLIGLLPHYGRQGCFYPLLSSMCDEQGKKWMAYQTMSRS